MDDPARSPLACGALGHYQRQRVLRIAALLGDAPHTVHEDESSMLMLDRDPIEWRGKRQRGLGWVQGDLWRPRPALAGWEEAARRGACGLVIDGRRRFLHSAVNGLAPLYWIEDRGAVYFASRIDPLVRSSGSPLGIDWDAWAAIVALRYPLGDRTPFAEVRRLLQSSTLRCRLGRARAKAHSWPWEKIEPGRDLVGAADRAVAGLSEVLAPVDDVTCPLSGGNDSRMLFFALARDGRASGAVTVSDDEGGTFEEDRAEPVAAAFGVPHERLSAPAERYPADWEERASRVEYQFVDHAWLVPLARRLEGSGCATDGFGIDVFLVPGRHFYSPETLDNRNGRAANGAMFETLRRYGLAHQALAEGFHGPIQERSREQFLAVTRRFEGHPSQAVLALYTTRSMRGVSTYPTCLLGDGARVLTPGATDPMVSAALSVEPSEKLGAHLYEAIFERLAPASRGLRSTTGATREPPHLPRRWRSSFALEAHRRSLADGPLADHLSPELRGWLAAPDGVELSGDLRLGMEAVSLLHTWWRRYRPYLRDVDARDLLG